MGINELVWELKNKGYNIFKKVGKVGFWLR